MWPEAAPPSELPFEEANFAGPPPNQVSIAGQAVDPSGLSS
jgi:hypothetical protein